MDDLHELSEQPGGGIGHNKPPAWARVREIDGDLEFTEDDEQTLLAVLNERLERDDDRIADIKAACDRIPEHIDLDDQETLDLAIDAKTKAVLLWQDIDRRRETALSTINAIWRVIHGTYCRRRDQLADGASNRKLVTNVSVMLPELQRKLTDRQNRFDNRERAKREAEARAREEEARRQRAEAERLRREEAEAAAAAARKRTEEARAVAQAEADRLSRQREEADRVAHQGEAEAMQARQSADAKPAELTRTRSAHGALLTTKVDWRVDPKTIDQATVDLEAIRYDFSLAEIEAAINRSCKKGRRQIGGAIIREIRAAVTRAR